MALSFEVIKNLTTEVDQNVEPYYVRTPYLIHEPDNSLFQYYIKPDTNEAWDKRAMVSLGQHATLPWSDLQHHLSTRAVAKIGAKQFPQIGAIGFYKDLYTSQSYILAPVHDRQEVFDPPTLAAALSGDMVRLSITPPEDVTYTCYKVIMRNGFFAVEYVVYNLDAVVAKPLVKGVYEVTAIGYNELTGVYSSASNTVALTITSGRADWLPEALNVGLRLSDLLDVNLVDLLNAQMLRFNAATQKWENVSADRITEVILLANAWIASEAPNTYMQVLTIDGITSNSKVDLQPSAEQLVLLRERAVTLSTANENGQIVVYAVGTKPHNDYTMQATITEVAV